MDKNSAEKLFGSLSDEDKKRVESILADRKKTEQVLKTPQAQALLKKLMGEK